MTDNFHVKLTYKNKSVYVFPRSNVIDVILWNLSSVVDYIRLRSDLSAESSIFQTPGLFMGAQFVY